MLIPVTIGVADLAVSASLPQLQITVIPAELLTSSLTWMVDEAVNQVDISEDINFDVVVTIMTERGEQLPLPGLLLVVEPGINTLVAMTTVAFSFSGPVGEVIGTARVTASLIRQGQDGSVSLSLLIPTGYSLPTSTTTVQTGGGVVMLYAPTQQGLNLSTSRTVRIIAASVPESLQVVFRPDWLFGTPENYSYTIVGNRFFSTRDMAPVFLPPIAAPIGPLPDYPHMIFDVDLLAADGRSYTLEYPTALPQLMLTLEVIASPDVDVRVYPSIFYEREYLQSTTSISLLYDHSIAERIHPANYNVRGHMALEARFLGGARTATFTMRVSGLPFDVTGSEQEYQLIDQLLSTITLTVIGESEFQQEISGEAVSLSFGVELRGSLGFDYLKFIDLALVATSTAEAVIEEIPLQRFRGGHRATVTFTVTPDREDVPLRVLPERSNLPAGVATVPAEGLEFLVRRGRRVQTVTLTTTPDRTVIHQADDGSPVVINFELSADDQIGVPIEIPLQVHASTTQPGARLGLNRSALRTFGGVSSFVITVTPEPNNGYPVPVRIAVGGLPVGVTAPVLNLTVIPRALRRSVGVVRLQVANPLQQAFAGGDFVLNAVVTVEDPGGNRIGLPGLVLSTAADANTRVLQSTQTLRFSGSMGAETAQLSVQAQLRQQGTDGMVTLSLVSPDALSFMLPLPQTVRLVALPAITQLQITLHNDLYNARRFREGESYIIEGNRIFSKRDMSPAFIPAITARRIPPLFNHANILYELDLLGADGQTYPRQHLRRPFNFQLQLLAGPGLRHIRSYANIDINRPIPAPASVIPYLYDPSISQSFRPAGHGSRGFAALQAEFRDGFHHSTFTLRVAGTPGVPAVEYWLIDQQLSTVTLTVVGEVMPQRTAGEVVEITVQAELSGHLGFAYRKDVDLNLKAHSSVAALIQPISTVRISGSNRAVVTLRVVPRQHDVPLTIALAAEHTAAGTAVEPVGGLQLMLEAFRLPPELSTVSLTVMGGNVLHQQLYGSPQPVTVDVMTLDQYGDAIDVELDWAVTTTAMGTVIMPAAGQVMSASGSVRLMFTVLPGQLMSLALAVRVRSPAGISAAPLELTVIPALPQLSTIVLVADGTVEQLRTTDPVNFTAAVILITEDGERIGVPGLMLGVMPELNTRVSTPVVAVGFSGRAGDETGTAQVSAELITQGLNGLLQLSLLAPPGFNLLTSATVRIIAASVPDSLQFVFRPDWLFGTPENYSYTIVGNRFFSTRDLAPVFLPPIAAPIGPLPDYPHMVFDVDLLVADGRSYTLEYPAALPRLMLTLEVIPSPDVDVRVYPSIFYEREYLQSTTSISLLYDHSIAERIHPANYNVRGFMALEARFQGGARTATFTMRIGGLPFDVSGTEQEYLLIDQLLSTITLTVIGESEFQQEISGEAVSLSFGVELRGSLGFDYIKFIDLALVATSTAEAVIEQIPLQRFRGGHRATVTFTVTPDREDVPLRVLPERSNLPAGVAMVPAEGLEFLVRRGRRVQTVTLTTTPDRTVIHQADDGSPVVIRFELSADDQIGVPIEIPLQVNASTTQPGAQISLSRSTLRTFGGVSSFVITVTPEPNNGYPVPVRITVGGLPVGVSAPILNLMVIPRALRRSVGVVSLQVANPLQQAFAGEDFVLNAVVTVEDPGGNRISLPGLTLSAVADANTRVLQSTQTLRFSGSMGAETAQLSVQAQLRQQGTDGMVTLSLVSPDALSFMLPPPQMVRLVALPAITRLQITLYNDLYNARRLSEGESYIIEGNRIFSKRDMSPAFIPTITARRIPPLFNHANILYELDLLGADGQTYPRQHLRQPFNFQLQLLPGSGLRHIRSYANIDINRVIPPPVSVIDYVYDPSVSQAFRPAGHGSRGFAALQAQFRDGFHHSTFTLRVAGTPGVPAVEYWLIDQQLSTVTLTVVGEVMPQRSAGEVVEITVQAELSGHLGFAYRKDVDLNLKAHSSVAALIQPISTVRISGSNRAVVTLRVVPRQRDVPLIIALAAEHTAAGTAVEPVGGLQLLLEAFRPPPELSTVNLTVMRGKVLYQQQYRSPLPVTVDVMTLDQYGDAIDVELDWAVTTTAMGTVFMPAAGQLMSSSGTTSLMFTVLPGQFMPLTLAVQVRSPAGISAEPLELTVVPELPQLSTVVLVADEAVDQLRTTDPVDFTATVVLITEDGERVGVPGLLLAVMSKLNTRVSTPVVAVSFSGRTGDETGAAQVSAELITQGSNGSLQLSLLGPPGLSLSTSATVQIIAAEVPDSLQLVFRPDGLFDMPDTYSYIIDGNRFFSTRDRAPIFLPAIAAPIGPLPTYPHMIFDVDLLAADGRSYTLEYPAALPRLMLTLEIISSPDVDVRAYPSIFYEREYLQSTTTVALLYDQAIAEKIHPANYNIRGFMALEARFLGGARTATFTMSVGGLPFDVTGSEQEYQLIDQVLSTITLTVIGEREFQQEISGEAVSLSLGVKLRGSLGFDYRKFIDLALVATSTAEAVIEQIPLQRFRGGHRTTVTFTVIPDREDVLLRVLPDASRLPAGAVVEPMGGLEFLVRRGRRVQTVTLTATPARTVIYQAEDSSSVVVSVAVRADDEMGMPIEIPLRVSATTTQPGAQIGINRSALRTFGGVSSFVVTITPEVNNGYPVPVRITVGGLPVGVSAPVLDLTVIPRALRHSVGIISLQVANPLQQTFAGEDFVLNAVVTVEDPGGNRIGLSGLVLTAEADVNARVSQSTRTLRFSGSMGAETARFSVQAQLRRQGTDCAVTLSLDSAGALNFVLPQPQRVRLLALPAITRPQLMFHNDLYNVRRHSEGESYIIEGNRIFSRKDMSPAFIPAITASRIPPLLNHANLLYELDLLGADGQTYPRVHLRQPFNFQLQLVPGPGLRYIRSYANIDTNQPIPTPTTTISYVYDSSIAEVFRPAGHGSQGFSALQAEFLDGFHHSTFTLRVTGTPGVSEVEYWLIDQLLSTVTLTVVGEVMPQRSTGEAVEITVEAELSGQLGFAYRKAVDLSLKAHSSVAALIQPVPTVRISSESRAVMTLRVIPQLRDVPLTIALATAHTVAGTAVEPVGGLQLMLEAFVPPPELSTVNLTVMGGTVLYQQLYRSPLPVTVDVMTLDQYGDAIDVELHWVATTTAVGTVVAPATGQMMSSSGITSLRFTVLPGQFTPLTLAVQVRSSSGVSAELLELTVVPALPRLSTVVLVADEEVEQLQTTEPIDLTATVILITEEGERIGVPGLALEVMPGANTRLSTPLIAVSFSGRAGEEVGTAQVSAGLLTQGRNGSLQLSLLAPPGLSLSTAHAVGAVTIIAAPVPETLQLVFRPDWLSRTPENYNYIFVDNRFYSTRDLAPVFLPAIAAPIGPLPSYPHMIFDVDLLAADGRSYTLEYPTVLPRLELTLEVISSADVDMRIYPSIFYEREYLQSTTTVTLLYDQAVSGKIHPTNYNVRGFMALEARFLGGARTATFTMRVGGLPFDVTGSEQEYQLIDQVLSTITLTVIGESEFQQEISGEPVSLSFGVELRGSLGFDYLKFIDLALVATSTAEAVIEQIPLQRFRGEHRATITFTVTPDREDVPLRVLPDASRLPAGVVLVPAEGLEFLVRRGRRVQTVTLTATPNRTVIHQAEDGSPVVVSIEVRADDQIGIPIEVPLRVSASTTQPGAQLGLNHSALRTFGGVSSFVITVTPEPNNGYPVPVRITVGGLPVGVRAPVLNLTVIPRALRRSVGVITLQVANPLQQTFAGEDFILNAVVTVEDPSGNRIGLPDLVLSAVAGDNTRVLQSTRTLRFSGSRGAETAQLSVQAQLRRQGTDGALTLSLDSIRALGFRLPQPQTIRLVALPAITRLQITLHNDLYNARRLSEGESYIIEGNRIFSKRDMSPAFIPAITARRIPPLLNHANILYELDLLGADGQTYPRQHLRQPFNFELQLVPGPGLRHLRSYANVDINQAIPAPASVIDYVYNPSVSEAFRPAGYGSRGFSALQAEFRDGFHHSTFTLQVAGTPGVPAVEYWLIDQQLSTVTLTVVGEVMPQRSAGEVVEITVKAELFGSLGYAYRKDVDLNLEAHSSVAPLIQPIPTVRLSGGNRAVVTLRVVPQLQDVPLTISLSTEHTAAVEPVGGLQLILEAFVPPPELSTVSLTVMGGEVLYQQLYGSPLPVTVDVVTLDQYGDAIDVDLDWAVTTTALGTVIMPAAGQVVRRAGSSHLMFTVLPDRFTPLNLTVSAQSPAGLSAAPLELTVIPALPQLSTVVLVVDGTIEQQRTTGSVDFTVSVVMITEDGVRIGVPGLALGVMPGANTRVSTSVISVSFSGRAGEVIGTAQVSASLLIQGRNGSLQLSLLALPGLSLSTSRTVQIIAAPRLGSVGIEFVYPAPDSPNSQNYIRHGNRFFSRRDFAPQYIPVFEGFFQNRYILFNLSFTDEDNNQYPLQHFPAMGFGIELISGPGVFVSFDPMLFSEGTDSDSTTAINFIPEAGQGEGVLFSAGSEEPLFALEARFGDGVRASTFTLQVTGLPDYVENTQQEFHLIDQVLGTVTVNGQGNYRQLAAGQAVTVTVELSLLGTLGHPYKKNQSLNLLLSTVADIEIPRRLPLRFVGTNLVAVSFDLTPEFSDVLVNISIQSDSLENGVQVFPVNGLDIFVEAYRTPPVLSTVTLSFAPAESPIIQTAQDLPLRIIAAVRAYDQYGLPIEVNLRPIISYSVPVQGSLLNGQILSTVAGVSSFVFTVTPVSTEQITVMVDLAGIPLGVDFELGSLVIVPTTRISRIADIEFEVSQNPVLQQYPGQVFNFSAGVRLIDTNGNSGSLPGLQLELSVEDNIRLPQTAYAVDFSGAYKRLTGRVNLSAELLSQGRDGRLQMLLRNSSGMVLGTTLTVDFVAAPVLESVALTSSDTVLQRFTTEDIELSIDVRADYVSGKQVRETGLVLELMPQSNISLSEREIPIILNRGIFRVQLPVSLIVQGQDGKFELRISGVSDIDLPTATITIQAAEAIDSLRITLQGTPAAAENYFIEDRKIFSRNDNIYFLPEGMIWIRIVPLKRGGSEFIPGELPVLQASVEVLSGNGIRGSIHDSASGFSGTRQLIVLDNTEQFLSPRQEQIGLTADLHADVRRASLVIQVSGLPENVKNTTLTYQFFDQQISTVTVSVVGTIPQQTAPGEPVEITLQISIVDTLGLNYRKFAELPLAPVEIPGAGSTLLPPLQYSGSSPLTMTITITPHHANIPALISVDNGALRPAYRTAVANSLELLILSSSQSVTAALATVAGTTIVRQNADKDPVNIEVEVNTFNSYGMSVESIVHPLARAPQMLADVSVLQTTVTTLVGRGQFYVRVVPSSTEHVTVTIGLKNLRDTIELEVTVIPFDEEQIVPLDFNINRRVQLHELLFVQRWLDADTPDLIPDASGSSDAEMISGLYHNLDLQQLDEATSSDLVIQHQTRALDVNYSGTVDEIDIRILIRYQSGLRGRLLGPKVNTERVRRLLRHFEIR